MVERHSSLTTICDGRTLLLITLYSGTTPYFTTIHYSTLFYTSTLPLFMDEAHSYVFTIYGGSTHFISI